MKILNSILLLCGINLLISCENAKIEDKSSHDPEPSKTEIITKTYAVKFENENALKDTINMIQSIIVDQTGKELVNIYYNLDNTEGWRDEYTYDTDGNKIGSKYYEDQQQISYYEYDIDERGRRIAYRAKDVQTDTLLYDGASQYENDGQLRKDGNINKEGEFKWNYEYEFDETGKELGYTYISRKSGKRFPRTYEYTAFDKNGEWIERKTIEDNKVISIETREFVVLQNK